MFLSEEVSRTLQLVVFIRKKRSNACREKSAGTIVMPILDSVAYVYMEGLEESQDKSCKPH